MWSCFLKFGDVDVKGEIPKLRYNVGEEVPVTWCLLNGSAKKVTMQISLVENLTYVAGIYTHSVSTRVLPHTSSGDVVTQLPYLRLVHL